MKRIFSFIAVLAIIFTLVVPVFAEDNYSVSGKWKITSNYLFTTNSVEVTGNVASRQYPNTFYSFTKIGKDSSGLYFQNGNNTVLKKQSSDIHGIVIDFGDIEQTVPEWFYTWLSTNAVKMTCDGSTCPATDANHDNFCDDCGMMFSVLRDYTPTDFPTGYPPVPSLGNPDARYYMYRVQSSNITYIVAYPSTVTPTYDSTKQNGQLYFSESYGNYRLDKTNNEWVLSSDETPYTIGGNNSTSVDNLYSSVQIKDENGENFFPIPLWEKVEKVTKGEIPTFQTTLGGTITTLTLCGVGLIALLVALSLFGKVFHRFQVK